MSGRSKFLIVTGVVVLMLIIMIGVFRSDDSATDSGVQAGGLTEDTADDTTSDGSGSRIQIIESNGVITASDPDVVVPPPTEDEPVPAGGDSLGR